MFGALSIGQISERLGELFCSRRWLPLVFAFCLQRLGIGTKRPVCARAGSLPASQDRRKDKIKFSTQSDVMMSSFYGELEEIEKNPEARLAIRLRLANLQRFSFISFCKSDHLSSHEGLLSSLSVCARLGQPPTLWIHVWLDESLSCSLRISSTAMEMYAV